jgi:Tfp pilus assembly protein PilN
MNSTNLLPMARQLRQARLTRIRLWAIALGAVVGLTITTYTGCAFALTDSAAPTAADFSRAARELAEASAHANVIRAELTGAQREVYSAHSLSEQPDLSLLLNLLSRTADERIVLSHCELTESQPGEKGSEAESASIDGAILRLDGFGKSQTAVAAFVLRLETTGVFDRVTLLQSHSQVVLGSDAAAFRIECAMQPKKAVSQ